MKSKPPHCRCAWGTPSALLPHPDPEGSGTHEVLTRPEGFSRVVHLVWNSFPPDNVLLVPLELKYPFSETPFLTIPTEVDLSRTLYPHAMCASNTVHTIVCNLKNNFNIAKVQ